ncbi:MAG: methyltransferase [Porticoccaceae bacterium]
MTAGALLLPPLVEAGSRGLLVADENCVDFPFAQLTSAAVLSNRRDIADAALRAGCDSHFSDFDFTPWQPGDLELIAAPLAKEKAVVHHIANSAAALLAPGGRLILAGGKQEGIKTFAKTLAARLGGDARLEKHGTRYLLTLHRGPQPGPPLDDRDYPTLRPVLELDGSPVLSKPGLFGWDRIDAGSALLAEQLPAFFNNEKQAASTAPPRTLLDLGCGYGYLSLMAARCGDFRITATDNCAAALLACERNLVAHGIDGEVIASDAGDTLDGPFDTLLCNPPFHQGFQNDRRLTDKFIAAARRLLHPRGRALFVVNNFVPLEGLAAGMFGRVQVMVNNGRFKVIVLGPGA